MNADAPRPGAAAQTQRIDKWLWHARIVKTRTLAGKLALSGQMRVNRQRVLRASQLLRVGDVLTFVLGRHVKVLRVAGFAERRGGADSARLLYEDLSPPAPTIQASRIDSAPKPVHGGRPSRKDRRIHTALTRSWPN